MNTRQTKKTHVIEAIFDTLNVHFIGQKFTFSQFKEYYLHNYRYSPPIISDSTLRKRLESSARVTKHKNGNRVTYEIVNFARPKELTDSLERFYKMNDMEKWEFFYLNDGIKDYLENDLILTVEGLYNSLDYAGFYLFSRTSAYGIRASLQDFINRLS